MLFSCSVCINGIDTDANFTLCIIEKTNAIAEINILILS